MLGCNCSGLAGSGVSELLRSNDVLTRMSGNSLCTPARLSTCEIASVFMPLALFFSELFEALVSRIKPRGRPAKISETPPRRTSSVGALHSGSILKSPTNEGVSPRNHFAPDNQWVRSPRSSASTSPMFSTQQTHFAPAADPEKDPVAALGLLASTPLLDRRAQPSPPPRYRSLSKPNSPQKEKTDQWEEV